MNVWRDWGVWKLGLTFLDASSLSRMKQCRIAVDEKEKTERNTAEIRYAMSTTMIMGKMGEYTSSLRAGEFIMIRYAIHPDSTVIVALPTCQRT